MIGIQRIHSGILYHGRRLKTGEYNWHEDSQTFSSDKSNLVIDLTNINDVNIKVGPHANVTCGKQCNIQVGHQSFVDCWDSCTVLAGNDSIAKVGRKCRVLVGNHCIAKLKSESTIEPMLHEAINTTMIQHEKLTVDGYCDSVIRTGLTQRMKYVKGRLKPATTEVIIGDESHFVPDEKIDYLLELLKANA